MNDLRCPECFLFQSAQKFKVRLVKENGVLPLRICILQSFSDNRETGYTDTLGSYKVRVNLKTERLLNEKNSIATISLCSFEVVA